MAIEIVDFPMKHGDFPVRYVSHSQSVVHWNNRFYVPKEPLDVVSNVAIAML